MKAENHKILIVSRLVSGQRHFSRTRSLSHNSDIEFLRLKIRVLLVTYLFDKHQQILFEIYSDCLKSAQRLFPNLGNYKIKLRNQK